MIFIFWSGEHRKIYSLSLFIYFIDIFTDKGPPAGEEEKLVYKKPRHIGNSHKTGQKSLCHRGLGQQTENLLLEVAKTSGCFGSTQGHCTRHCLL